MPNQNTEDKRQGQRVDFKTQITLRIGESEYHYTGSSKDLSLKGLFVNSEKKIPMDTNCLVQIFLTGMTEKVTLNMRGQIVRTDDMGTAIAFTSMDLDSYTHLKNIVRYNISDPDDIQ